MCSKNQENEALARVAVERAMDEALAWAVVERAMEEVRQARREVKGSRSLRANRLLACYIRVSLPLVAWGDAVRNLIPSPDHD